MSEPKKVTNRIEKYAKLGMLQIDIVVDEPWAIILSLPEMAVVYLV